MTTLTIKGGFGVGNIGDDAILISMLDSINCEFDDPNFIIFSGDSNTMAKLRRSHRIKTISFSVKNMRSAVDIIKYINDSDLFVFGGGGLLYDHHGPFVLLSNLSTVIIAKILRKPIIFYSIGVGPLNTIFGKLVTKIVANNVSVITVRDLGSEILLKELGINKTPICVASDPAISLLPEENTSTRENIQRLKNEQIHGKKIVIGLSLRFLKTEKIDLKIIANVCDQLVELYDAKIVFFPMCQHKHAWHENDLNVANELIHLLKHKNDFRILKGDYTPSNIKAIIGHMDLFIGMRLHSLIFSASMCVPTIGIVYDPKVKEFLHTVGQERYLIDIHNLDGTELLSVIRDAYSNKEQIISNLKTKIIYLQKQALIPSKQISKLILKS